MIKITFDGNEKQGFNILAEIPYDILVHKEGMDGKGLFCDEAPDDIKKENLLLWARNAIFLVEEVNIFEHEMVIIHTDTSFEPGPGKGEHFEELEDTSGVGAPFDPNHSMTAEQMLEQIAQGKIDPSTLPASFPDEE
jgi:hypothetical protein